MIKEVQVNSNQQKDSKNNQKRVKNYMKLERLNEKQINF